VRRLILPAVLLLSACASVPKDSIRSPLHTVGDQQVGWEERKASDGNPLFVVKSIGAAPYDALLQVAEEHAHARCPDGYRVMALGGADQPTVDIVDPRIIIGSELRLEVHCFERDKL